MKYGSTFHAQSVPQWAPRKSASGRALAARGCILTKASSDNIDYNELKTLIKVHTTKDQAQAIPIPGQKDTALAKFEQAFLNELSDQHDRVDLFVNSKADEISRRLGTIICHNMPRATLIPSQNSYRRPFPDCWLELYMAMAMASRSRRRSGRSSRGTTDRLRGQLQLGIQ
jgi:hypothetical protein